MTSRGSGEGARQNVTTFSILGHPVAIHSDCQAAHDAFRRLYRYMPLEPEASGAEPVSIVQHRRDGGDEWEAIAAGFPPRRDKTLGAALQRAETHCCIHTLRQEKRRVALHVATILFGDDLALITGESGAGKTTLTLALAARGFRVDGDDVGMLDPDTGLVQGLPRCFHLDDASVAMLLEQGLDVRSTERCEGFLTPSDVGDGGMTARPVRSVLFLSADNLPQPALKPMPLSEAVARLERQIGPRFRPSSEYYSVLTTMLGGARCFELRRGPLTATVELVMETMQNL